MKEYVIQRACVRWFRYSYPEISLLLFSVNNGAYLQGANTAQRAKRWNSLHSQGAVKGVADLILLVPRGEFNSLSIELKTDKGRQSEDQKQYQEATESNSGKYIIVRSLEEFDQEVTKYLNS